MVTAVLGDNGAEMENESPEQLPVPFDKNARDSPRQCGQVRHAHTIFIVSVIAMAAMVGGSVTLYLRAIRELEESTEELSQEQASAAAQTLQRFFLEPQKSARAFRNYIFHTTDRGVLNATMRDTMMRAVKHRALDYITKSQVLFEVGIVLLPKRPAVPANVSRPNKLDWEQMVYSHVWYDVLQNGTDFTHAHYIPGEQPFDTANYSGRPLTTLHRIDEKTGQFIGNNSLPFPPDHYARYTEQMPVYPVEGNPDPSIATVRTVSTAVSTDLEKDNRFTADGSHPTEEVLDAEWRSPQMWTSTDGTIYSFLAWDTFWAAPTDPAHPFHGYGMVQVSTFFIFGSWDRALGAMLNADSAETILYVYDRQKHYLYSPSNSTASDKCKEEVNFELNSHESKMSECSVSMKDTLLTSDILDLDTGKDRFVMASLDGEDYYLRFKHVYKTETTVLETNRSAVRMDAAVVWARKKTVVVRKANELLVIFALFLAGIFLVFLVLFTAQLAVVNRPLRALMKATQAMADLDMRRARRALDSITVCARPHPGHPL